jgi:hypothetical protein
MTAAISLGTPFYFIFYILNMFFSREGVVWNTSCASPASRNRKLEPAQSIRAYYYYYYYYTKSNGTNQPVMYRFTFTLNVAKWHFHHAIPQRVRTSI